MWAAEALAVWAAEALAVWAAEALAVWAAEALAVWAAEALAIWSRLAGRCPSGQREQTVNLPAQPTKVRILPGPRNRGALFRVRLSGALDA